MRGRQEFYSLEIAARLAEFGAGAAHVMGRQLFKTHGPRVVLNDLQHGIRCEYSPQTLPPLRTARKIFPPGMPAAVVQASIAALTQAGTATERTHRFDPDQVHRSTCRRIKQPQPGFSRSCSESVFGQNRCQSGLSAIRV